MQGVVQRNEVTVQPPSPLQSQQAAWVHRWGAAVVEEAENEQNPPGMLRFAAFFAAFCTIFAAFRTIKNLCRHFQCQSPMWVLFSMLEGKPRGPKT